MDKKYWEMTEEELVRFVWNALLKQGRPSIGGGGGCRYQLVEDDGTELRCAAGHLLSDDQACAFSEDGDNWVALVNYNSLSPVHADLIMSLQQAHDSAAALMQGSGRGWHKTLAGRFESLGLDKYLTEGELAS